MLLLDVSVTISSGITSFWVSIYKRTTTFSPHGHKAFTWWYGTLVGYTYDRYHDVQFSCAKNQPLLAHHWRVHQCLLTSRFIVPSIPWGVSAPGGKMRKQLLKDHNFFNNSPIFIIEISTFNIFAFQKAI